ncbi:MAG: nuclear transport factor 2 family protein [Janthinobacterium lividum]
MGLIFAAAIAASLSTAGGQPAACSNQHYDSSVLSTLNEFFRAAEQGDRAGVERLTTSDFHVFEGSKDVSRQELIAVVQKLHDQHVQYHWSVEHAQTQVDCSLATVAYFNNGSITKDGLTKPAAWYESAVLRRIDKTWRVQFLQSERVK